MFFLIPLGIFIISVMAIVWIVSRKFIYLKKLAPEMIKGSSETQEGFWSGFFPGLATHLNESKIREHRLNFLAEFEKFLRRLRLLSLKFDTTTNRLIHRVRKSVVHHEGVLSEAAEQEALAVNGTNSGGGVDPKEEEQRLIIEIAKSPKDAKLYKKLGNIYMKTGEWHDAAESFKKVLELDPDDEIIRNKLERISKKFQKLST